MIGENGNDGPGPPLTRHRRAACGKGSLAQTLINPTAPMPSFKDLPPDKFNALVEFLSQLK